MPSYQEIFKTAVLLAGVFFLGCQYPGTSHVAPYQLLGRYQEVGPSEYKMNWPASGFRISFVGRELHATFVDNGKGIMDVVVNGEERSPIFLNPGKHNYKIISQTIPEEMKVTVTRRTEVYDTGDFTVSNISHDGRALKLKPSLRKMIFLGDSISAGFGVRGNTKECENSADKNAPLQAYAALTAKALEADYHLIAISGRGVIYNWDDNPSPVMPKQLDFTLADNRAGPKWDHDKFKADIIVVALGTNDWSVINPGKNAFRSGYLNMLQALRARHESAHIVSINGPLLDGEKKRSVQDGIDFAVKEMKDGNISVLELGLAPDGLIWSCNSHPGRDSMTFMANQLTEHLYQKYINRKRL